MLIASLLHIPMTPLTSFKTRSLPSKSSQPSPYPGFTLASPLEHRGAARVADPDKLLG